MALSKRDKIILDMAGEGKTASEISEATGFPVTRVALEIDRLLKDANWLDDFQKIRLLLHSYYNLKGELERKAYEDGDAKSATERVAAMTDSEVQMLAGKINSMPAGADSTGVIILLLLVGAAVWWIWFRR